MVARNIDMLAGVTHKHVDHFKAAGIHNTLELLNAVDSPKAKRLLARSLSTTSRQMTRWLYSADLLRIHGLSTHYANLLIESGICTALDLAVADVDQVMEAMQQINARKRFVKRLPAATQVYRWQEEARSLPVIPAN